MPQRRFQPGSLKVENPVLKGDEINFSVALGSIDYKFTGRIQGDRMKDRDPTCRRESDPLARPTVAAG